MYLFSPNVLALTPNDNILVLIIVCLVMCVDKYDCICCVTDFTAFRQLNNSTGSGRGSLLKKKATPPHKNILSPHLAGLSRVDQQHISIGKC